MVQQEQPRAFDPTIDPITSELDGWSGIGVKDLTAEDLANPIIIQMLIFDRQVGLLRQQKAEEQIAQLRKMNDVLRDGKEDLRVELTSLLSRSGISLAEIPASFVGGIGIAMIASSSADTTLGIILASFAALIVLIIRLRNRYAGSRKENGNG